MKREYDLKWAVDVVAKAGVSVGQSPKRLEFTSGSVGLRTLGAIDYLKSKHGFAVKSKF